MYSFLKRNICPCCGSSSTRSILKYKYDSPPISSYISLHYGENRIAEISDLLYELQKCNMCELVFQLYIGDESFQEKLYGCWLSSEAHQAEADKYFLPLLRTPRTTRDGHELMWVSKYLSKPLTMMRTFDYGMGWALWARISKQLGCESFGFDLSPVRMEMAAKHGVKILNSIENRMVLFDFINTEQVFEHVPDPLILATKLSRLLLPGGILKVSVPNGSDITSLLKIGNWKAPRGQKYSLDAVAPLEHINCFNLISLKKWG